MKKELIIVIGIIILIIVSHICTQKYTVNFFNEIENEIDILKSEIYKNQPENNKINEQMEKILKKWEEKYDALAYYIEHDELEKVQTELVAANANIETGDYYKSIVELDKCKFILDHIKDKDSLELVNIF